MLAARRDGQWPRRNRPTGQDAGNGGFARVRTTGPLEGAVVSGDKAALAAFYTTSPPAGAKTPRGETHDPAEEPAFWSSRDPQGSAVLTSKFRSEESAAGRQTFCPPI